MGRTVHYRTCKTVEKPEFEVLEKNLKEINSEALWGLENMKIWRGHGPVEEKQAWGFTKVKNEEEANLVIESIKELSSKISSLTWIVLDEGELRPRKYRVKDGELLRSS